MAVAIPFVPIRLFNGDYLDVDTPTADDHGKYLVWDNDQQKAIWATSAEAEAMQYSPSLDFSDERNSMYLGWW